MKKTAVYLMALLLILSTWSPLQGNAADDLTGYKYEDDMRELISLGIFKGYPDGTYQPDRRVTRAEFARIVVASFDLESKLQAAEFTSAAATEMTFTDVPADKWYAAPILDAVKAGIVVGHSNNEFKPDEYITREQMASMVARALSAKGVIADLSKMSDVSYRDAGEIYSGHMDDVKVLTNLGVVFGNENNTFEPKAQSERWMVALLMLRSRAIVFPPQSLEFQAAAVKDGKTVTVKEFETLAEAKSFVQASATAQLVQRSNQIVWMKGGGLAVANKLVEVFPGTSLQTDWNTKFRPYVAANTEMKYLDSTGTYVKLELAGKVGYVPATSVVLIPEQLQTGESYYQVTSAGDLIHYIYNHAAETYATPGTIGKAPSEFVPNVKYYSWDGAVFHDAAGKKITEAHQYFNKLQLGTATNYTAAELDNFLLKSFPYYNQTVHEKYWTASPLAGTGAFFKEIEKEYKINALYLLAHALHESQWGTSLIAQDKKNLFGLNAVDGDAYNKAISYATYRESIEHVAQHINSSYQNLAGTNYNGSFLGNKGFGMNVRYAADHFWGEKIAGHMYRADKAMGGKDLNAYKLGVTNITGLNFRTAAGAAGTETVLYQTKVTDIPVAILGETTLSGSDIWYQVVSENKAYDKAFVYGSGSLGTYIKPLPIVK